MYRSTNREIYEKHCCFFFVKNKSFFLLPVAPTSCNIFVGIIRTYHTIIWTFVYVVVTYFAKTTHYLKNKQLFSLNRHLFFFTFAFLPLHSVLVNSTLRINKIIHSTRLFNNMTKNCGSNFKKSWLQPARKYNVKVRDVAIKCRKTFKNKFFGLQQLNSVYCILNKAHISLTLSRFISF